MRKYEIWIDEEVESYFAASPIGPVLELGRVAREEDHPLFYGIRKSFELVQSDVLAQVFVDDNFCGLYGKVSREEKEWFAREWIIIEGSEETNSSA